MSVNLVPVKTKSYLHPLLNCKSSVTNFEFFSKIGIVGNTGIYVSNNKLSFMILHLPFFSGFLIIFTELPAQRQLSIIGKADLENDLYKNNFNPESKIAQLNNNSSRIVNVSLNASIGGPES